MGNVERLLRRTCVLNLDRRPDRLAHIMQNLHRAGVQQDHIQRFSAVDGQRLNIDALRDEGLLSRLGHARLSEPLERRIWGMDLTLGALGCALTHAKLWAQLVAEAEVHRLQANREDDPVFFVVEDDAVFVEPNFRQQLAQRMQSVPRDWELLYIGGLDTAGQCSQLLVGEGVSRVPQLHRTTTAYIIKPAAAKELLKRCLPITYQLDTAMTVHVEYAPASSPQPSHHPYIRSPISYSLQPPLAWQATDTDSDIQFPRNKKHT